MAWETRQRGTRYYTRSYWAHGRVIRQYIGGGDIGEIAAAVDAETKAARQAAAAEVRAERERLEAVERTCHELRECSDIITRIAYVTADFHRHKRTWRRRRHAGREG